MALTEKQKKEIDREIMYAVNEGCLDADHADDMDYQDKLDYLGWSEYMANNQEEIEEGGDDDERQN